MKHVTGVGDRRHQVAWLGDLQLPEEAEGWALCHASLNALCFETSVNIITKIEPNKYATTTYSKIGITERMTSKLKLASAISEMRRSQAILFQCVPHCS